MMVNWSDVLAQRPLVAILRGLEPDTAAEMTEALIEAGFLCLEVPLNSPRPLESIKAMREQAAGRAVVGAGTVLTEAEAEAAIKAGAQIVIAPNTDLAVIRRAKALGAASLPGVFTATEGFAAIAAGADALKLFPSDALPPAYLKALRAVISAPILAVGGVTPETVRPWLEAGASGFGIGSAIYVSGRSIAETAARAKRFVDAFEAARG